MSTTEQPHKTLSSQQIDFVSFVEQRFWETGSVPTVEKISEELRISATTIKKYWEDSDIRSILVGRGVSLLDNNTQDLLTAQQLYLANLLMNLHDKRTVREKCEEAGVTTQKYNAWMRTNSFQGYMRRRAEALFASADSDAYVSMVNAMRSGDQRAVQLYFEMRGIYNPKVQVDVNVNMVLSKVVEIIQLRVKDPEILMQIAADFEQLETGEMKAIEAASQPVVEATRKIKSDYTDWSL